MSDTDKSNREDVPSDDGVTATPSEPAGREEGETGTLGLEDDKVSSINANGDPSDEADDLEDDNLEDESGADSDDGSEQSDVEERPAKKVRRKRRDRVSRFLDVEAAVDEEEEDYVEDEEDVEFTGEVDAEEEERILRQSEAELRRIDRRRQTEEVDAEEQAAYYRERYGKRATAAEISASSAPRELLLPCVQDSLFVVSVRPGREQEIVIQLMRKYLNNAGKPNALAFTSVFYRSGWKGYVYIEAKHKTHVLKAVDMMMDVYPSKINLVPVADMPATLYVKPEDSRVNIGMWVRIRRGKFVDDLAKVVDLGDNGNRAYCKLMPRLAKADEVDLLKKRKARSQRLPQRLFNPTEFPEWTNASRENAAIGAFYKYGGEEYTKEGYLIKFFPVVNLQLSNVNPTLNEVSQFNSSGTISGQDASALAALQASSTPNSALFRVGEPIDIIAGELKGSTGKVSGLQEDTVTVKLDGQNGKETEVAIRGIRKRISVGDRVSVTGGLHEGEIGMVVAVDNGVVTVIAEPNYREIKVLAKDLLHATDTRAVLKRPGETNLHDLVQIDYQTVGVVVSIDRSYLHVLDQFGVLRKLTTKDIKAKQSSRNAITSDVYGHVVQAGDVVEALSVDKGDVKSSSARRGQILQIYQDILFVRSNELKENGGVFLVKSKNCRLVNTKGGRGMTKLGASPAPNSLLSRGNYRSASRSNSSVQKSAGKVSMRAMFEQGAAAAALSGSAQGSGIPSQPYGGITASSRTPAYGSRTPAYGSRTPAYGAQTPAYGAKTPAYGAQTPAYGAKTPAYGAQTPAYGAKTPAYGARTPAYGAKTPAYGARTPAYGAQTPAYGVAAQPAANLKVEENLSRQKPANLLLKGVQVRINGVFSGVQYSHELATVLAVNKAAQTCSVEFLNHPDSKLINLDMNEQVELVVPQKKDRVVILHSDSNEQLVGMSGTLIGLDNDSGIVKLDLGGKMEVVSVRNLGKTV